MATKSDIEQALLQAVHLVHFIEIEVSDNPLNLNDDAVWMLNDILGTSLEGITASTTGNEILAMVEA